MIFCPSKALRALVMPRLLEDLEDRQLQMSERLEELQSAKARGSIFGSVGHCRPENRMLLPGFNRFPRFSEVSQAVSSCRPR